MKRLLCLLSALLLLVLLLASCSDGGDEAGEGLEIVATNFPLYDFASRVAGENASVKLLLTPGAEPHGYEPSPSDMKAILGCDLFLYIGDESDAWVETLLETSEDIDSLKLIDSVEPLQEEDAEHNYDEHIWTDPQNAVRMTEAIAAALCAVDGAHRDGYESRRDAFVAELSALDEEQPQVLVSDIRMPGRSGLHLLEDVKNRFPDIPIIIMTAYSDLDSAVSAFSGGAFARRLGRRSPPCGAGRSFRCKGTKRMLQTCYGRVAAL